MSRDSADTASDLDIRDSRPDDLDPIETREWLESLDDVLAVDGAERARFLLARLLERSGLPSTAGRPSTPYVNSLPSGEEPEYPGDLELEERLLAYLRWNAMVMVVRTNREMEGLGGHIATYQSVATLFEVGFNHFWKAPTVADDGSIEGGDLVYFQGHASPGIYARAFLEGRLDESMLRRFRQEALAPGLSSYPHPWLMPEFWQFATVSMGLGPLNAIYQARFLKYLDSRGLADTGDRHVWAFLGDGEMDEVESLGALGVASREKLDNLIFLVNCNLQRLDGPVRGNGKIVQELESIFLGAGWQVLKVLWGSDWDPLLASPAGPKLAKRLEEIVDGEWQGFTVRGGGAMRERVFGGDPDLEALVEGWSDEQIAELSRGGHDAVKVYAAYREAVDSDRPTVILAQTVKGYGMGEEGEGLNTTHQTKKLSESAIRAFADRFGLPVEDDAAEALPYLEAPEELTEYLQARREALGGSFPQRRATAEPLPIPELDAFSRLLKASGDRTLSTTMAFVQILRVLNRQKGLAERLVPILADEARTFGMEGLFQQMGIYSPVEQRYVPVDAAGLSPYTESLDGQMLQEGINEAGALASWTAAGTAYSTTGLHMVPFYIFYSMFGFQRVGDLIWAAADMQARGFLLGATSGRTTLNGEGLQHEDGHSHLIAATVPNCLAYDPTYHYEVAVILQDGMRRMYGEADEAIFYYLTLTNESYSHPAMPEGAEEGILRGLYLLRSTGRSGNASGPRVQLLGCGAILREVEAAATILADEWNISADVWSAPSLVELRRDGLAVDRWNRLHPEAPPRRSWIAEQLDGREGPLVASTDYQAALADGIRPWVDRRFVVLGTDGFGRSDSREALRRFFEVDRHHVVVAALGALAAEGVVETSAVAEAIRRYEIDPERPDPTTV